MEDFCERLTVTEERSKRNESRIKGLELRQGDLERLVASVSVMATEQEHIKEDVREIKTDVKLLAEKPARRWEAVVEKLIFTVAAALAGFILAKFGL